MCAEWSPHAASEIYCERSEVADSVFAELTRSSFCMYVFMRILKETAILNSAALVNDFENA